MALFDTALDTKLQNVVNNIPIPSQLIKKIMIKLKLDSSEDILFLRKKNHSHFFRLVWRTDKQSFKPYNF